MDLNPYHNHIYCGSNKVQVPAVLQLLLGLVIFYAVMHSCFVFAVLGCRSQSFSSKSDVLPSIPGAVGSLASRKLPVPMQRNSFHQSRSLESASNQERLRQLEERLSIAELSNRELVDEMVRIQKDLK